MKIRIDWQEPILVARHKKLEQDWQTKADAIEGRAGVYFFARQHGTKRIPFYIGESVNLRRRLEQLMKTAAIMDVLRSLKDGGDKNIRQGARYFHYGYLATARGQNAKSCLAVVQRHMIETAMAAGYPILNKQLTAMPTHELMFDGSPLARGIYAKTSRPRR